MAIRTHDLLLGYADLEKANQLESKCDSEILRRFNDQEKEVRIVIGHVSVLSEEVVGAVMQRYKAVGWRTVKLEPGSSAGELELILKV